jgi:hypothetical protein
MHKLNPSPPVKVDTESLLLSKRRELWNQTIGLTPKAAQSLVCMMRCHTPFTICFQIVGYASSALVLEDFAGLCNAYLEVLSKDDEDHVVKCGNHAPACLKHNSHKVK